MFGKKILIFIISLSFFSFSFALAKENSLIEYEKKSIAYNSFEISLKKTPSNHSTEIATIKVGERGEIVGKPIKNQGFNWIKIVYDNEKKGWIQENFIIRENYYSIKKLDQTLFLQERISLSGTERVYCSTGSSINLSNILTSFRPEPRVFNYTPSERSSSYSGSSYSYNGILTSFRPEPRIFKYVVEKGVSGSGATIQNLAYNITTSFRPDPRIYNYTPSERSSSYSGSSYSYNGILTSFRPEPRIFNYTPSERSSSYSGSSYSYNGILTSFRPEPRVFNYTPSERSSSYSGSSYSYNGILTSFRPEPRVYNYTPANFACIPIE